MKKSRFLYISILCAMLTASLISCQKEGEKVVKIGLLHSTTGSMAFSEQSVLNAELMAIEEINKSGGVLGCHIEAIQENGESEATVFAKKAEKLISEDKVVSIFGCWTSDSRKAVKTVVEDHYNLLWYPVQYEGMEASPNIIYLGACPNQQVVPAIDYCVENFGKRVFLIGSDYSFPQIANKIIKAQLKELGATCVGEVYVPMGESQFHQIIQDLKKANPDVIINTLNGDSNIAFFTQFHDLGLTAKDYPIMSFSIAENEIAAIGPELVQGHYVSWNYFESIETSKNKRFTSTYRQIYGEDNHVGDPVEAGYLAIYLWAAACEKAGSFDIEAVRIASKDLSFIGPEGMVTIEDSNQHLCKVVRIGRIQENGQISQVWSSYDSVRPDPYLSTYAWARGL